MTTHASIIPLIGGMTLAQEKVTGKPPEYLMTYDGFQPNETHLLNHYKKQGIELPYFLIDRGEKPSFSVDVVNTTCPCAGLSQFSTAFGAHNETNRWMIKTAEYILGELQPKVFWGENARGFAGDMGKPIREKIRDIGRNNGYSMTVYRTKSLLHGNPQIRERSFYFFWKDTKAPILNYYERPYVSIEEMIRSARESNFQQEPHNPKVPSKDDPYYRYALEEMYGGIDHKTFSHEKMESLSARSNDVMSFIELMGHDYERLAVWMRKNGYEREVVKCERRHKKINDGKNIMRRGTIVPKDRIGAFVGHYPSSLTHPDEDRYVTYREAMTIMGLPKDFELLDPKKNVNHICQNVPVQTASDMATEVEAFLMGERPISDSNYVFQYNGTKEHRLMEEAPSSTLEDFLA